MKKKDSAFKSIDFKSIDIKEIENYYAADGVYSILLAVISVISSIFVCHSLDSPLIGYIFFGIVVFIFVIVLSNHFFEGIRYIFESFSPNKALVVTVLVFLFFPITITCLFWANKPRAMDYYLDTNEPEISVNITYSVHSFDSVGNVGNDWEFEHFLNGKEFEKDDILKFKPEESLQIKTRIAEEDLYDDISEAVSRSYSVSSLDDYGKTLSISQVLRVVEKEGAHRGSYKEFKVDYSLERVNTKKKPDRFWVVFLYSEGGIEHGFRILLIVGMISCLIFVIVVIVVGRKRREIFHEKWREVRKQLEQEEKR